MHKALLSYSAKASLLLPGIIIEVFTQKCPFCGNFLGILFFAGKKNSAPIAVQNLMIRKREWVTVMKPQKDKDSQKNANIAGDSADGLAIGLSLGVLFGIVGDNIGLGLMIGAALGLCGGPVFGALQGKKKETKNEEKKKDEK